MVKPLTPEKLSAQKNKVIRSSTDAYFAASEVLEDRFGHGFGEEKYSIGIFMNDKNIVRAVHDFGSAEVSEINRDLIAAEKRRSGATKLVIADKPRTMTWDENEELKKDPSHTPKNAAQRAFENDEEVKAYLTLQKQLAAEGIKLADVICMMSNGCYKYSGLSRASFPEFADNIPDHRFKENKFMFDTPENREKVLGILASRLGHDTDNNVHKDMSAIFLDNSKNIVAVYDVPLNHRRIIPGLFDKQECMLEEMFEQAILDKASSIAFVRSFDREAELAAYSQDILLMSEINDLSESYNKFPLEDYILLKGTGIVFGTHHESLSLRAVYNLK